MADYKFTADIAKFDPNATGYFGENALVLADCARLAYRPEKEVAKAMQQWGFQNFKFFNANSTQAFVAGNDTMVIVAFRGTAGLDDLWSDAKAKPAERPFGDVHEGFNDALQEVWGEEPITEDMRAYIKQFQDNNQSIWFCGHSLGAALAALATAEFLLVDGGAVNGLYTIGQPRVGNGEFAKNFNKVAANRSFRFVNNNDVVTRVPVPGKILDYTHVGRELYIDSSGILHSSIPWWKKSWDRLKGAAKDIGKKGLDGLKDHGSDRYVELIEKNRAMTL